MEKTAVRHPDKSVHTGSYSAGIACDGWLYVSGHASQDLKTGKTIGEGVEEQTKVALISIEKVLQEGGCTLDDVVKCTCYLARIDDFDRFDKAYSEFFRGTPPARSTVQAGLGGDLKVEIDAIARIPSKAE